MKPVIVDNENKEYECKAKEKCPSKDAKGKCTLSGVTTVNGKCVMHS